MSLTAVRYVAPPTPRARRRAEAEAIYQLLRTVDVEPAPETEEYVEEIRDGWKQITRVTR